MTILECALAGSANLIVSGDRHLTKLKIFRGIAIVRPADFLRILYVKPKQESATHMPWPPELIAYWRAFGRGVGTEVTPIRPQEIFQSINGGQGPETRVVANPSGGGPGL